jgi:N-acetylglutamate synthase-like GNAT family acetyltransferase
MLTIRKARAEDCASISNVHVSAVRAIPAGYYSPEELEAFATPRPLESYQQLVQYRDFYVATNDNGIVGFGILNRDTSMIDAVFASPAAKGQRVGMTLLETLEELGRSLGLKRLSLNASMNAVGFYLKAGYVAQEESTHQFASGASIRCVPMIKELVLRGGPGPTM